MWYYGSWRCDTSITGDDSPPRYHWPSSNTFRILLQSTLHRNWPFILSSLLHSALQWMHVIPHFLILILTFLFLFIELPFIIIILFVERFKIIPCEDRFCVIVVDVQILANILNLVIVHLVYLLQNLLLILGASFIAFLTRELRIYRKCFILLIHLLGFIWIIRWVFLIEALNLLIFLTLTRVLIIGLGIIDLHIILFALS